MKYARTLATIALLTIASCTDPIKSAKPHSVPLAESISRQTLTQAPASKCECKPQETLFSKISGLLKKSDIVLVSEYHFWVAHYTTIISNMEKLHELGVRKVFLEFGDGIDNAIISEYQQLRRRLITQNDLTQKEKDEILKKIEVLSNSFTNSLLSSYDPAKPWYLMALIERAAFMDVEVICIDMPDSEIAKEAERRGLDADSFSKSTDGVALRNTYMSERILAVLEADEKALVLVGQQHVEGLVQLLSISTPVGSVLGYEE